MMAQRLMDSECLHEGVVCFYGKWFCREHAPRPAEPIPNQDEGWECCSIDPPCEQPGHTLHSGLWFCREHALLHKVEAHAQWEGWHILEDTARESFKRLERKHMLLGILLLLWWWEAPWGWYAAGITVTAVGWMSSVVNSLQKERVQEQRRQEERSEACWQAKKRNWTLAQREYQEQRGPKSWHFFKY